ncbi:protein spaetzle-like [Zeugodacus cucurbitae]|uniref:protein spaetzle-like n=1 Tax=Zeugodacus cucurbitae TaxID=28588 RepID=UPI0023D9246D|nr:protein spaetzle-like [Zeugodacus cucurbitae]
MKYLLKMLTFFVIVLQVIARPMPSEDTPKDVLSKLKSIFKVGEGIMVYNTGLASEGLEDDEIVCAERRAGKSYCKEVENYIEATRLDKIDPEQFAKFKEYFKDDLAQPQMVATRMGMEKHCNTKTKVIYPEGAESMDNQWLLVMQYGAYKQGVLVEECENEAQTGEENSTLPVEEHSKCKQNFNYRKLVVLVNGAMKEKMVKLPSTCECVAYST